VEAVSRMCILVQEKEHTFLILTGHRRDTQMALGNARTLSCWLTVHERETWRNVRVDTSVSSSYIIGNGAHRIFTKQLRHYSTLPGPGEWYKISPARAPPTSQGQRTKFFSKYQALCWSELRQERERTTRARLAVEGSHHRPCHVTAAAPAVVDAAARSLPVTQEPAQSTVLVTWVARTHTRTQGCREQICVEDLIKFGGRAA
jgi:hypothetical protein